MFRFPENIRCNHVDDGSVVLDTGRGLIFSFNRSASRILQLLEIGAERDAIVERIVQEFGAAPQVAESDVCEFLNLLQENQLLES